MRGNYIGTDVTGTQAQGNGGNGGDGIVFDNSPDATVGGTTAGDGNLISANIFGGLAFEFGSDDAVVQGNLIGTDVTGTVALPNYNYGVDFTGSNITIGGTTAAARNLVSGNDGTGIILDNGSSGPGTSNLVMGNYIGVNITGTKPLANDGNGLYLEYMGNITVGGTTPGAANVISANQGIGIWVYSEEGGPELIEGNEIGTDRSGTVALGNTSDGIAIEAAGVTVGGTTAAARNIISANGGNGVNFFLIFSAPNPPNVVEGNSIGTDATGTIALGNAHDGVLMSNYATGILIGGTKAADGNTIAYNAGSGVGVVDCQQRGRCDPVELDLREPGVGDRPGRRRRDPEPSGRTDPRSQQLPELSRTARGHHLQWPDLHQGDAQQCPRCQFHRAVLLRPHGRSQRLRPGPDLPRPDHGDDRRQWQRELPGQPRDGRPVRSGRHRHGDRRERRHVRVRRRYPGRRQAQSIYAGNDQYHIDLNSTLSVAAPGVQTNDLDTSGKAFSSVVVTGPSDGTLTLEHRRCIHLHAQHQLRGDG